uniref:glucan endo-1,3-beta-D-glucosidase n=1 Tax=Peronospora matthiolae TaxID=2874970 RepID=A0AAV1TEL7_9STRA
MKIFLRISVASILLALYGRTDALNVKMPGINFTARIGPDWAPDSVKCKSADQIQKDMYALKTVTDKVRIYSLVDCNQAELVLRAAKVAGLQVHLGIWTTANHNNLLREKTKLGDLIDMGLYDDRVIGLHVGSEAMYREEIKVDVAISYMNEIRDFLRSRGKNTLVTITDVIDIYNENPQLVDAVDYVSVNQFAFWEQADVNEGAAISLDRLRNLRILAAKKNKKVIVSEVGWSSGGYDRAAGITSPENQAKFFSDYFQMARSRNLEYYWYVAFDSKWRVTDGDKEVEADFGVFNEDDTMKSNFQQLNIGWREPRAIRNAGTQLLLSENGGNVYMSGKSSDWLVQEQQVWFFDSATQQVRSKSSDRCLDAYQGWDAGIVHVFRCMDQEVNQKWVFDSATGQLKHVKHQGFCLDTDPAQGNKVQLYGCSANNANQKWSAIDPATI